MVELWNCLWNVKLFIMDIIIVVIIIIRLSVSDWLNDF